MPVLPLRAARLSGAAAVFVAVFASAGPAQAPAATPGFDFSGVILPQFRYQNDDATTKANGGNSVGKFDVERVYLTFKMPAGADGSIRVTTDVFNNGSSCTGCYAGWNIRLKYAYFQYNALHNIGDNKGMDLVLRFGMEHTALIDHEEGFWARYISQTAVERNGFFASSDVGVAGLLTLPNKTGELYATVQNGGGYGTTEQDPYKDYAARLSVTPFGGDDGILKTFTISPWIYIGKTASKFLTTSGSAGTGAASGLTKNRNGVFVGLKDRRLTAGLEYGQRTETVETGTSLATRGTYENTGNLTSGFVMVRPVEWFNDDPKEHSPWGIVARLDNYKPYSNATAAGAQTTSAANQLTIFGIWYDVNQKASFSLDVQHLSPQSGSTTSASNILFLHGQVNF